MGIYNESTQKIILLNFIDATRWLDVTTMYGFVAENKAATAYLYRKINAEGKESR